MSNPTKPMHGNQLTEVANLLDKCRNMHGELPADVRARIFAAIDTPSDASWLNARTIIVAQNPDTTLWQAVITAGAFPEDTPTAGDIMWALTNATAAVPSRKDPAA